MRRIGGADSYSVGGSCLAEDLAGFRIHEMHKFACEAGHAQVRPLDEVVDYAQYAKSPNGSK